MPKVVKLIRNDDGSVSVPLGAVRVDRATQWGNPFVMDGEHTRKAVCDGFKDYAIWRNEYEPKWLAPLRGKDLACWCTPKRCHADTLLKLANAPIPKPERQRPPLVFTDAEPSCKSKHKDTFLEVGNWGGYSEHCWECGWYIGGGMVGHN